MIETEHPNWDDERVFQTARNTVIVVFIKIVVEDYINHISPLPFTLRADPSVAWDAPWNKPNWITTEFSLLYRWHALIPDQITWNKTAIPVGKTLMDNKALTDQGLLASFAQRSTQQSAELGPRNTAPPLLHIYIAFIKQDRLCALASYSGYCDYLGINRLRDVVDRTVAGGVGETFISFTHTNWQPENAYDPSRSAQPAKIFSKKTTA